MLIEHEGFGPRVAESAYVAPNAVLCGDVRVGERTRILFGAVLTAEAEGGGRSAEASPASRSSPGRASAEAARCGWARSCT